MHGDLDVVRTGYKMLLSEKRGRMRKSSLQSKQKKPTTMEVTKTQISFMYRPKNGATVYLLLICIELRENRKEVPNLWSISELKCQVEVLWLMVWKLHFIKMKFCDAFAMAIHSDSTKAGRGGEIDRARGFKI